MEKDHLGDISVDESKGWFWNKCGIFEFVDWIQLPQDWVLQWTLQWNVRFHKGCEFCDWLSHSHFLKKYSAPWSYYYCSYCYYYFLLSLITSFLSPGTALELVVHPTTQLQVSDCSTLYMCDVSSTAAFVHNPLNAFLILFPAIFFLFLHLQFQWLQWSPVWRSISYSTFAECLYLDSIF
jgi:hypothetical protein